MAALHLPVSTEPGLEHQHAPQLCSGIAPICEMGMPCVFNCRSVKEAMLLNRLLAEQLAGPVLEAAPKPAIQGDRKALFGTLEKVLGNMARENVAQNALAAAAFD